MTSRGSRPGQNGGMSLPSPDPSHPRALRGHLISDGEEVADGIVAIEDGRITWSGPVDEAPRRVVEAAERVEGRLIPGLVDLHCHGGGGASFPEAQDAGTARMAIGEHLRHGTTSVVASLVTATPAVLRQRVGLLADLADAGEIAGIHLEGPFLAVDRCGAQNPDAIIDPDPRLTRELLGLARGHLVTMTIAPERPGAQEVAALLAGSGALPSFGHTVADDLRTRAALADVYERLSATSGARSGRPTATHLFNGMNPLHHREPGPIAELLAAASAGRLVVELIGDGVHVSASLVRTIVELVGAENVALITDAMAAAGMPDGQYVLGSLPVTVSEGTARLTQGGAIAGGTAHLLDVVRTVVAAGLPLADAVYCATAVPAAVLGRDDVGTLRAGARADVLVTDRDLRVEQVLRAGEQIDIGGER